MTTTYRELRLLQLDDALGYVRERGSAVVGERVRHTLSVAVHLDGEPGGYALCVDEDGRHVVELALSDAAAERGGGKPLADTILRKMQAAGVGTARVRSLNDGEAESLWQAANWLERIPCWDDEPAEDASVEATEPSVEAVAEATAEEPVSAS